MRPGRVAVVLLIALAGAAAIASRLPLCPSALFLGIPCPGCGLTRASLLLISGDLAGALRLHPLSPLLAPLSLGLMGLAALRYVRGADRVGAGVRLPAPLVTSVAWALFALVFGVWGARFLGAFGGPAPVESLASAPFHASY